MNPSYLSLVFDTRGFDRDIWMAMLSEWPFESFQEEDDQLTGYILRSQRTEALLAFIREQQGLRFHAFREIDIPDRNWNEVWEHSFQPVAVDHYWYIRAQFHAPAPPGFTHEIIIAPKMAFGTGHHATTYMMLAAMSRLDFRNKRVLDFGCGTGILSVAAALQYAQEIIGVDIQPEAIDNSVEHATLNHAEAVCHFREGGLEKAGSGPFDMLLANINTKIIEAHFDEMLALLPRGGYLLLSGIMVQDDQEIESLISSHALHLLEKNQREDWLQYTLQKA